MTDEQEDFMEDECPAEQNGLCPDCESIIDPEDGYCIPCARADILTDRMKGYD